MPESLGPVGVAGGKLFELCRPLIPNNTGPRCSPEIDRPLGSGGVKLSCGVFGGRFESVKLERLDGVTANSCFASASPADEVEEEEKEGNSRHRRVRGDGQDLR